MIGASQIHFIHYESISMHKSIDYPLTNDLKHVDTFYACAIS